MTDIIERLRNGAGCNIGSAPLRQEAADEIERLTALLTIEGASCRKLRERDRIEIERLAAIKRDYEDEIRRLNAEAMNAGTEIEGLQAEVSELARLMRRDVDTIKQQAAENERLRAALKQIVERYETAEDGWPAEDMRTMARRALEQKP